MKQRNRFILFALLAVGLALVVLLALRFTASRKTPPHGDPATPVTVARATRRDIPLRIDALGTVTPRSTITVKTQVSGTLNAVLVKEGQTVKAGQVVARIDSRALRAQMLAAQGTLEHDQAELHNAEVDLQRYRNLIAGGSVSKQTLDTAVSTANQYRGTVKYDQGTVENLRVQVGYCDIVAPVSGRIGLLSTDAGNYVLSSDTTGIATITSEDPTTVVFSVTEEQIGDVVDAFHDNGALPVTLLDRDKTATIGQGTLAAIDNIVNTTTGMVKLKAAAANPDGRLFPERFVNVRMTVGTARHALVVPGVAVQRGASGSFVLVLGSDNKAHLRHIETGVSDGSDTVVSSGALQDNDQVIVEGADKLDDGSAVRVVKE
ncbi:MAG: efflux RND transporter periplasmic adaptor subunit [Janthinobacterium lividum]